jgi:actin-like ATPase involved in cell morphogenesis
MRDEESAQKASIGLERLRDAFLEAEEGEFLDSLRVELFHLVQDIVTTGMVLGGGGSLLASKALPRYYRELMMFNANGLNAALKQRQKTLFQGVRQTP